MNQAQRTSARKFPYAVVIGRFQPVHFGHQRLIEEGLRAAERVIVVVGSDRKPRSVKNPFTFDERERMVRSCLRSNDQTPALAYVLIAINSRASLQLWVRQVPSPSRR